MRIFSKRKRGNRRFEREHVLDVRVRTREVRGRRLRMAATAMAIAVGTLGGLYGLWRGGGWALNRFVLENDAFAITQVDVKTDGVLSREQLRRWSGVRPGDNLLRVDLARVRRDLEFVPMIRSASADRVLPHILRLSVTERVPLAQVKIPQFDPSGRVGFVVYFLDETGYVLNAGDLNTTTAGLSGRAWSDLPLLAGLGAGELIAGRTTESARTLSALRLLTEFDHSPMAGLVDLETVNLSSGDLLVVTTGQGGQIIFRAERLDEQMRRWRAVHDLGRQMGRAILSLDLSVSNNVPALWLEATSVPATPPKVNPAPRTRKKNV